MRIIAYKALKQFWDSHPAYADVIEPTRAWFQHTEAADWKSPADVKADLRTASILKDGRVVFNLAGNKYRLVVWINYPYRVVYIRFIGTHKQYDAIDVQTI
jgi:mRNA interferase HigB